MSILVVGARGHIGGAVARRLLMAGVAVRASSRTGDARGMPLGVEVVQGDLTDPSTFAGMLEGVEQAFIYAHAARADEFAIAARSAGVEHIALLSSNSVLFPTAHENPVAVEHMNAETALVEAGLEWTFVRPGYLATNTYRWREPIRARRLVRGAFPNAGTPLVHERDVAEVAAAALLDPRYRGQAHLVLGGDLLTEREQVAAIGTALGEPVAYETVDIETYRRELTAQIPAFYAEAVIAARGEVPQVPEHLRHDVTEQVLGRAPLPFSTWAADHAEDFR